MPDAASQLVPRPVDHCVLPVADLGVARARYGALGFTVAPDGVHPFGTRNVCIYLADGTFLEPLAVGDADVARAAARRGNVFVARDAAYRFRNRGDGFSAFVMATKDTSGDHRRFVGAGLSGGRTLRFSRGYKDAQGKVTRVSFRLACAADLRAPDVFFFSSERINAPSGGRGALAVHENGVAGLAGMVMVASEPDAWREVLETVTCAPWVRKDTETAEIATANATITLVTPSAFARRFGGAAAEEPGLRLRALRLSVGGLAATRSRLEKGGVAHEAEGGRLLVQPAPGQGATIEFSERT